MPPPHPAEPPPRPPAVADFLEAISLLTAGPRMNLCDAIALLQREPNVTD